MTEATAAAKKAGVPIDTIAFGTVVGHGHDPGRDRPGARRPRRRWRRSHRGAAASRSPPRPGNELNSVYDQIRRTVGFDTVRTDITEWFTGLALLLAVLTAGAALVLDAAHSVAPGAGPGPRHESGRLCHRITTECGQISWLMWRMRLA